MRRSNCTTGLAVLVTFLAAGALAATPDAPKSAEHKADTEADKADGHRFEPFKADSVTTSASVTVGGRAIAYQAVAGTLIVHPKGWDDVPRDPNADKADKAVMPDLANAMKLNPNLKVQLHAGYFDLATPFYQGVYEMHHLPMPQNLQANIEYCFYESGHMVYAKDASLRQLHDNVADFIGRTSRSAR